jgi:hypothetical protein
MANNAIENVDVGYNLSVRGFHEGPRDPVDRVNMMGNLVRNARLGFHVKSDTGDCPDVDTPNCLVEQLRIENSVAFDADTAFILKGGRDLEIVHSSSFGAQNRAFFFDHGWPPSPPHAVSEGRAARRSLAHGPGDDGFWINREVDDATLEHVNAYDLKDPYTVNSRPDTALEVDPKLGDCRVYIPDDSPMASDGRRIGANLVYRYDEATLSEEKLWNQHMGRFPCGRAIPEVHGSIEETCHDLHERVGLASEDDCPIP